MAIPFQTGIDIVSVSRMRLAIERQGKRFLDRIFTKAEQAYCDTKRNKYENYAARFAAKEAVIKAKRAVPVVMRSGTLKWFGDCAVLLRLSSIHARARNSEFLLPRGLN